MVIVVILSREAQTNHKWRGGREGGKGQEKIAGRINGQEEVISAGEILDEGKIIQE